MKKKIGKIGIPAKKTAWDLWLESDDGKSCCEGTASGKFLENRLWSAFQSGIESMTTAASAREDSPCDAGERSARRTPR